MNRNSIMLFCCMSVIAGLPSTARAWKNGIDEDATAKIVPPGTFGTYPSPTMTNKSEQNFAPSPDPKEEGPDDVLSERRFHLKFSFHSFENCHARLTKVSSASLGIYTSSPQGGMALINDIPKFCRGLFPESGTVGPSVLQPPHTDPITFTQPDL